MYFLFAEDFDFLPPRCSRFEQSSAAGLNQEPGLSPTARTLQPKLDQLQGLLALWSLSGAAQWEPSGFWAHWAPRESS